MATLVKLRKLTTEERAELERLARSRTEEARLVVRAKIVLGLAAGERPYQVADRVGVGRAAAYEWLHRFNAEGLIAVKRAFSWAEQQGLIPASPLRTLRAGRPGRRTRVLTADELAEILAAIRDSQFREFLQAMVETGCRPSEVARVTAADVDLDLGVWVFDRHKTAKKTGKPRVVYLTPAMVELSRKLVALYPDGPLFRGPRGKAAFTKQNVRCRFKRLRKKLPHLKHFVCYNVRHTFATRALLNGVGVAQVAELLGHTSTEMVSQTYGHLAEQVAHMRDAARKATSG
jgi:integrase